MSRRHHNDGLRKRCDCARRAWPKCPHSWWFNFQPRGGKKHYRVSLDKIARTHLASKTEAAKVAATLRAAILDGTFDPAPTVPAVPSGLTIDALMALYLLKQVRVERPTTAQADQWRADLISRTVIERADGARVAFGTLDARTLRASDLDALRSTRLAEGHGPRGGRVAVNRAFAFLRAMFGWAIRQDLIDTTPFKKHGQSTVRLLPEVPRDRRLHPGEEEALLQHAEPHLRALIVAALETCCRLGELLNLRWADVDLTRGEISLSATRTKAKRARYLPISATLKGLLELRQHDPDGETLPATAYVFGDPLGRPVKSISRAWLRCVLAAHGHTVKWTSDQHWPAPASLAAYKAIDLHFHDLRREAGSRLLESRFFSEHLVQRFLDHANLSTTSRYLTTTRLALQRAMTALDAKREADAIRCTPVAQTPDQEAPAVPGAGEVTRTH